MKHVLRFTLTACLALALLFAMTACNDDPPPAPHTHTWVEDAKTDATCTEDGSVTYTCTCGETKTEPLTAVGHAWDDGKTTAPGCEKDGYILYTCTACGTTKREDLPATGHTYSEDWSTDDMYHWHDATCGHADKSSYEFHTFDSTDTCTVCSYHTDIPVSERTLAYKKSGSGWLVTGRGNVIGDTVTIPATHEGKAVKGVDRYAFGNDLGLVTLIIEEGVGEIKDSAFNGCLNLLHVTLPASCDDVAKSAFLNTKITTLTALPEAAATVPVTYLTEVVLLASDSLPNGLFSGATSLTTLTVPASVTEIGSGFLHGCGALTEIRYGGTLADWMAIEALSSPLAGGMTLYFNGGHISISDAVIGLDKVSTDAFTSVPASCFPNSTFHANSDITQFFPDFDEIVAKGRGECPIYGIYAYTNNYMMYADQIGDIGFACVRTNSTGVSDLHMERIISDGVSVMATVGLSVMEYVPNEYKESTSNLTTWLTAELQKWKNNPDASELAEWFDANVEHALNFLRRYGPNGSIFTDKPDLPYNPVTAIETFNEPNFGYMISHLDNNVKIKQTLYAALHNAIYDAVKAEFGDAVTVVAFGAGGAGGFDTTFIADTLAGTVAMKEHLDVISTHPYWDTNSPFASSGSSSIPGNLKKIRDAVGYNIPVWYTEGGWQISPAEGGTYTYGNSSTFSTQMEQGAMLVQEYILGMRIGVDRIMYMYIMDTDNCNYGVLNIDGTYRKAAYAIRTLTQMMPDPLIKEVLHEGKDENGKLDHIYVYTFESAPGAHDVTVAFTADEKATVDIPWEGEYALVTDMFGMSRIVRAEDGVITLEVGAYMQYLTHVEVVSD